MRQFNRSMILATVTMTALATQARAEGGANAEMLAKPEMVAPAMVAAVIMFFLLLWFLKGNVWGPISNALTDREVKIRTEIETAENARSQATAALDEYQRELATARADAGKMITQAKQEAQRVADELRANNEVELAAIKEKATADIESAKRQALAEIYNEAASISTMIAGRILDREISADDHRKLVEESLGQLQGMNTGSNGNG